MILLVNPRATRAGNRRFPLSLMAVGAALPSGMRWEIVDGSLRAPAPAARVARHVERGAARRRSGDGDRAHGNARAAAREWVPLSRELKRCFPHLPIV